MTKPDPRTWPVEELELLRSMVLKGIPLAEMAPHFPTHTPGQVQWRIHHMHLKPVDSPNYSEELNANEGVVPLNPFRGTVRCLGCGNRFESWDRRKNRMCLNCSNSPGRVDEYHSYLGRDRT